MVEYIAGNTVPLTYQALKNGVATNTTPVSVSVYVPDGTVDGPYTLTTGVTRTTTGNYTFPYPTSITSVPGQYSALWQSPLSTVRTDFDVVRAVTPFPNVRNAIARMVAADQTPLLDDDALDALVEIAAKADGTFDLRRAAAEGWRWKAAKVAGAFNLSIDGGAINRGDLLAHCREMVRMYSRGKVRSLTTVNKEADTRLEDQARFWREDWYWIPEL